MDKKANYSLDLDYTRSKPRLQQVYAMIKPGLNPGKMTIQSLLNLNIEG